VGSGLLSKAAEVTQLSGAETLVITRIPGTGIAVWCSEGKNGAEKLLEEALPFIPEVSMQESIIDSYLPENVTQSRSHMSIGGIKKRTGRGSNRDSSIVQPSFGNARSIAYMNFYTFAVFH
jgi:hypothetical protein